MATDNFVMHIYRHDQQNPAQLVGQIENVDQGQKQSFDSMQSLWDILTEAMSGHHQDSRTKGE